MRDRSREMLQVLARSTKRFSEDDLREFLTDIRAADTREVLAVFAPAPAKRKAATKTAKQPADPFVSKLDKRRRKFDLPAAAAADQIAEAFGIKRPAKQSLAKLLSTVRTKASDVQIEAAFEKIVRLHADRYSMRYDLS